MKKNKRKKQREKIQKLKDAGYNQFKEYIVIASLNGLMTIHLLDQVIELQKDHILNAEDFQALIDKSEKNKSTFEESVKSYLEQFTDLTREQVLETLMGSQ